MSWGSKNELFQGFYVLLPKVLRRLSQSTLHKKWSFSLRFSSVSVISSSGTANLVKFTGEILNEKLHFLSSAISQYLLGALWETLRKIIAKVPK